MSTPEQELKRLLHYGRQIPFYQPGDRLFNEFYHSCILSTIENLVAAEKLTNTANCIVKAFSDGYSAYPAMLVYALAVCVKQQTSEQLRAAAYKAVKTVCSSSENFFLFIKFATKLSQEKSIMYGDGVIGGVAESSVGVLPCLTCVTQLHYDKSFNFSVWGSGCRKVCKDWYLKKDVKTLAELVGRQKKRHGWAHKDIIKLIHLKTEEPARAAIIKYLLFGIKAAKKEYGENSEAVEILNYLQAVEDFKNLTDEQQAARNIEIHNFTLDHVPPHLVKFKEVWSALIQNMPLPVLLKNLERITYLGFLKPNSFLVGKVSDALLDKNSIADSHLHPAQVYFALRNYETSSKFVAAEKARKKRRTENGSGETKKVAKTPPKPNPNIIYSLQKLFECTCKLFLPPTGLRYFVAIDLKSFNPTEKCYRCQHVNPAQAAVLTTLCLLHADRNVCVRVAGPNDGLVPIALTTALTVQQGVKKLEESGMHRMKLSTPLEWTLKKKEEHDVFVVITDTTHKGNNNALSALQKYREEMKLPNVKLVLVLLKCHLEPFWVNETKDPGIFVIGGFDENVPRLIEAFSRGAF